MTVKALIASGTGRYADPWHPFDRTSPLLAALIGAAGFDVAIDEVDAAMQRLDSVDLLVVNAGDPWRDDRTSVAPDASVLGLDRALERGIGVLAVHSAVSSLRDYPAWAGAVGGMWVPSASWHPELSPTRITGGTLPDGTPVADFEVTDERYSRLQRIGASHVAAWHETDEVPQPTAWARTVDASRVVADVLGHDERSYASQGHRDLITALVSWATQRP